MSEQHYDDLGRLSEKLFHNGMYLNHYTYNIRDWLTGINGTHFSQSLHYTDGIGNPCYNGNISSMTWSTDSLITKGYTLTYDGLSRLKNAVYGEGPSLFDNPNRFNEQVTDYDRNGNILGLLRCGRTSTDSYGLVDNLNLVYDGNQLQSVSDNVILSAASSGMEFNDGAHSFTEYVYDANGNLTKDLNKKIIDIQYNCLNLPCRVEFENGNSVAYLYDANGTKLRTTHVIENDTTVTGYCGNVVYENGVLVRLLTEAGYVSLNDNRYHYFIQDHQGNNRMIVDEDGNIEEVNDYYPFGGLMASYGDVQPYKYNGKELDGKGGLDWYDYGARHYDVVLGRWNGVDPSCEKYYTWSPYAYCKNNPVLRVDPNGKDDYTINNKGQLFRTSTNNFSYDRLIYSKNKEISIVVNDKSLLPEMYAVQKSNKNAGIEYYNSTANLDDAVAVFKFGADNTGVEWKLDVYDDQGSKTAIVGTSGRESSVFSDVQNRLGVKGDKVVDLHSHPYNKEASDTDMRNLRINTGAIYYKAEQELLFYDKKRSRIEDEVFIISTSKEMLERLNDKFMK